MNPVAHATITPTPANTATRAPPMTVSCWSLFIPMHGAYEIRPLQRSLAVSMADPLPARFEDQLHRLPRRFRHQRDLGEQGNFHPPRHVLVQF